MDEDDKPRIDASPRDKTPDERKADMSSANERAGFDARLKYLESIASQTVARLYAIETRLGLPHGDWGKRAEPGTQPQRPDPPAPVRPQPPVTTPATPPHRDPKTMPPYTRLATPPVPAAPGFQVKPPTPSTAPPIVQRPPVQPPPAQAPPSARPSVLGVPPPQGPPPAGGSGAFQPRQVPPPPSRPIPPMSTPSTTRSPLRQPRPNLETRIGGNWFNRIGVIAIILGVGFLFKYAYDNRWIKPWGWVSIGVAIGIVFLIGGEKTRKKYESYAYGLTGCGISLLYVSVFAAFKLWELVPQPAAFAMMAVITAVASLLAARYSALAIAVLGLIGGFLTPLLLSTGQDNEPGLFGYVTLLDLGVLTLAYSKQWRSLNYLAFGGTVLMFSGWATTFYSPDKLWTTVVFLTVFFAIFALLAVLYNVIHRRLTTWLDLGLVFVNAALYFGTTYEILEDRYHHLLGAFAVVVAGFYLALGYFTYRRDGEDRLLVHTFIGLSFLFSVLAVPIQLDQHWVTMAWAIEGAVMTWVGLTTEDRTSRYAGLVVFLIAATHWLRVDVHDFAYESGRSFLPVLNERALSCGVLVASLAAASWLYRRYREKVDDGERSMFTGLYILGANAAALLLLSLDANDYFERAREAGAWRDGRFEMWNDMRQFTLSVLWTIYGTAALAVGITLNQKLLRIIAFVLLAGTTLKVLAIDLAYFNADWRNTIVNQTFASLGMLVFGLALAARLYSRSRVLEAERRAVTPVLILAANILALVALTTEPLGYFGREIAGSSSAVTNDVLSINQSLQFTLTAVWTLYAAVALAIGFKRNSKSVRVGALLLLAFSAVKTLLVNAGYYDALSHRLIFNQTFGAFALLVGVMALGVYLYSRSKNVDARERRVIAPLLVGAANVLAVIALSLEPLGYFKRAMGDARGTGSQPDVISQLDNWMQFSLIAIWSVYAMGASAIGFLRNTKLLRVGALLLLGLGMMKFALLDAEYYAAPWHRLLLNQTFGGFALLIAAMSLSSYLYSKPGSAGDDERETLAPMLVLAANILAILAFSLEAIGYFKQAINAARLPGMESVALAQLRSSMHFSLTAIWTIYSAVTIVIGVRRNSRAIRVGGLLLLALALAKVFAADILYYDAPWRRLLLNQTFGGFALLIAAISLAVFSYSRFAEGDSEERRVLLPVLAALANVLAIIALSVEAFGYYAVLLKDQGLSPAAARDLRLAQHLSLSVIWTVYGGGLLIAGIWRRSRMLRIMALILLSVTIVKVFLLDMASLDKIYRIISFIVLGAILIGVSYLYQRYRQRTGDAESTDAEKT